MGLFKKKSNEVEIFAPVDGEIISIEEVEDEVFQQKMMGDGFAFKPDNGEFVAPMSGTLTTVFPTKHAYGIKNDEGVELLLHIGIDTVELQGDGFELFVQQGKKVKVGEKLVDVNLDEVSKKVPSMTTPIVFPELDKKINVVAKGKVKKGDLVAVIV